MDSTQGNSSCTVYGANNGRKKTGIEKKTKKMAILVCIVQMTALLPYKFVQISLPVQHHFFK